MNFKQTYESIISTLITEAEGDEGLSANDVGVDGVDVLDPDQESALGGDEEVDDPNTDKNVDLTNVLLKSLRFKPSKEFQAYINMPRFHNLSSADKLTTIRNVLSDHPERIVQEAEGDEPIEDFGDMPDESLGLEISEEDLLRLIIRSLNVNPYALEYTLKSLPAEATPDNFEEIISTVESSLF